MSIRTYLAFRPAAARYSRLMGDTRGTAVDETEVGSYFVANYPPFSVWTADAVERDALPALSSPRGAGAARPVPARPVLPEALPLLLLPRLHRQERAGGRRVPRRDGARVGALQHLSRDRRPAAQLRVLRRRHAVVPLGAAAERPGAAADGGHAVDDRPRKSRSSASRARSPNPSSRRSARWA